VCVSVMGVRKREREREREGERERELRKRERGKQQQQEEEEDEEEQMGQETLVGCLPLHTPLVSGIEAHNSIHLNSRSIARSLKKNSPLTCRHDFITLLGTTEGQSVVCNALWQITAHSPLVSQRVRVSILHTLRQLIAHSLGSE
jgi:hypothetical protein